MRCLRDWIREKMRRRPRRGPNESESTGKIGQELPANQLAPLRPTYPDAAPRRETAPEPETSLAPEAPEVVAIEAAAMPPTELPAAEPAEKQMVIETQP